MTSRPDISVIMPCHNAARTLRAAIASVRAQTLDNWELICINDSSTDDTPALLDECALNDARISATHTCAGGAAAARNIGVRAVRGEYTFFLDADDQLAPSALASLLQTARSATTPTVVTAALDLLDADGRSLNTPRFFTVPDFTVDGLLRGNNIVGIMTLVRTELLGPHPFEESLPSNEDWDLWLRLASHGVGCTVIPRPLLHYRLQPTSLSRRFDERYTSAQRVVQRWLPRATSPRAVVDAPLRVALACGTLAMPTGDQHALTRFWNNATKCSDPNVFAPEERITCAAACLHWAWQFTRGAFGETWTTHGETWLAATTDWVANTPLADHTHDIISQLRELAFAPTEQHERVANWLHKHPDTRQLVIYGVGTNGQVLLHRLQSEPLVDHVTLAIADDNELADPVAALHLPRVDPRAWTTWPAHTRVIVTPNDASAMRQTLARAGGRPNTEFLVLNRQRAAQCAPTAGATA